MMPASAVRLATILAMLALALAARAATPGPFGQRASDYVSTFAEEFDSGLSSSRWNNHIWYESSNLTINYAVENGSLKIWPQRDAEGNFVNRTLDTDGHFAQQNGYFEIEARLPVGKGVWPAFWLLSHSSNARPEIDIMEAYPGGGPSSGWSDSNLHPTSYAVSVWRDANAELAFEKVASADLSAAFHKYAVKWEANTITFYFDGKSVSSVKARLGEPMYILLDLWFGSASGPADTTTPQGKSNAFEIRYVRAWRFR
jgi:beta-glucanase (GH16 family)